MPTMGLSFKETFVCGKAERLGISAKRHHYPSFVMMATAGLSSLGSLALGWRRRSYRERVMSPFRIVPGAMFPDALYTGDA
jgi:hypothetical protein